MVQNNKVLTVSYGTFSCTLEGFDDSFETMKAIAEYFRDLSADDRYFGSEPPQPDAEMLTRIARRDRSQQVEASQSDSGLLLRATGEVQTPASPPAATSAPVSQTSQPAAPDLGVIQAPPADPAAEFFAQSETDAPAGTDSIAAKLQRIRAVVSHSGEATSRYNEDEEDGAGFVAPAKPPVDAISAAFAAGALNPEDLQEQNETAPQETPVAEAPEAEAPRVPEPIAETPVPELGESFTESAVEEDAEADIPVQPEAEATTEVAAEGQETATDDAEAEEQPEVTTGDVLFTDLEEDATTEVEPDEIVNILNEEDDTSDKEDVATSAESDLGQHILSAADEAKLLDEITLVESDLAKRTVQHLPEANELDEDVSRLMDTADAHMDDPETTDQRETYSHLRTAVAATEAERAKNGDDPSETRDKDYREDFESVVSPRRPEIQVTSIRPESDAAPLKLVAEQRVDTDEGDLGPVMPRRVTAEQENSEDEEGGFANFAQEQGAQSLPDLLEAAAAYLSFIEGQEQFSRPQLMNKVRSLKQEAFNREESLRTFGQLLRDGKIEKAGGGRFAASNQIGFRPDDKRAAG